MNRNYFSLIEDYIASVNDTECSIEYFMFFSALQVHDSIDTHKNVFT